VDWVSRAAGDLSASIIDVGGGESTLVDDLLAMGYRALTVLDVADAAMERSRERLGAAAQSVRWIVGDVGEIALPARAYDVWHDRAVFHFLTEAAQREAYVRQLTSALRAGGQVVMATFGPEGPQRCSGLDTMGYDGESLNRALGPDFEMVRSSIVTHRTPRGRPQQFLYCQFSLVPAQKGTTS
jgi:ubiquinone/menaquinone biosynthesis C-methylase UbiE